MKKEAASTADISYGLKIAMRLERLWVALASILALEVIYTCFDIYTFVFDVRFKGVRHVATYINLVHRRLRYKRCYKI